ncbi:Pseudouridine kinase [Aquimixticola soesokkakensis]|uniref:Pseudouridine kinase n=1 Tax=Aquimixticola soesokkakensis TaxID=1519096 RepID=A0A1Y5SH94_9RHOB|nr:PfkB family carbohydrate kinase [Aquimixticola soesokkakensis]SLN40799.1 Pseudouridine kinase [Aquimixticola soesokkakensis]
MTHSLEKLPVLCIGSVLWDIIGRSSSAMRQGSDVPGRITRVPGGVAMNIAMALARFDVPCELLSAVGRDAAGDGLLAQARARGLGVAHLYRSEDLPTDSYMAIEGANGLIAAIADAHSLEQAGDKILRALEHGPLGTVQAPFGGTIALDGNLTLDLLRRIAKSAIFARADLRVAPASPGKAERLAPFFGHAGTTFYVNLEEAGLLCHSGFDSAQTAARAMVERGATRALVTDGGKAAAFATADLCLVQTPPPVLVARVTGAGDTFMAAHIAAERNAAAPDIALSAALTAAAAYVSGETPL